MHPSSDKRNKPNTKVMHTLRKYIKVVSAFLLINFLFSTFLPTISYALTAGPTAPEATSFEPIDTTDMVNLQTGDFTYNIPLLEVPGPSGRYPLSLSYHAGIMPGEEASWVGLGWTLNPGAINRTVNGYPDDHYGAKRKVIDDWEGGSRSTFSTGIGLPGASYGLSFSQDTYQGFGIGANAIVGYTFGQGNAGINVGVAYASNGYGQSTASPKAGFVVGKTMDNAQNLVSTVSLSTNFKSVSLSGGIGYNRGSSNLSVLGVGMNSSGGGQSLSVAGFSANQINSQSGNIQMSNRGFSIPIPLGKSGFFLNLGYNYTRYWSHEESEVHTYGAIYPSWSDPNDNAYDSYSLLDSDVEGGAVKNDDADKVLGGSLPSYDQYQISGQGLGGSMRPYAFQKLHLYRQNVEKYNDPSTNVLSYHNPFLHYNPKPLNFRFINDFSSKFHYENRLADKPKINKDISSEWTIANDSPAYPDDGYIGDERRLAGSKHIEYVTNEDIRNKTYIVKGLMFNEDLGEWPVELYGKDVSKQIGAYVITNSNGVKYHYARPVYTYDELIYTKTVDDSNGEYTNRREHPAPYAYTWYLTAVTGPDYVDRDEDGVIGSDDWGYWVKFDYGKWTDEYVWRNPGQGYHKDIDHKTESFSIGKKEIYYLDAISTKTHTALFVKDIRDDAKSDLTYVRSIVEHHLPLKEGPISEDDLEWLQELKENPKNNWTELEYSERFNGGFLPIDDNCSCNIIIDFNDDTKARDRYYGSFKNKPVSSLKLSKILLLKNNKIESFDKSSGTSFDQRMELTWVNGGLADLPPDLGCQYYMKEEIRQHYPENLIDIGDEFNELESEAIRVIEFESTNNPDNGALQPETPNSFSTELVNSGSTSISLQGKLTLKSLTFNGKGGTDHIPPTKFEYELEKMISGYTTIRVEDDQIYFHQELSGLEEGDLIKFQDFSTQYYALVSSISDDWHYLKMLGKHSPTDLYNINWSKTKNPPYNKDFVDIWGMYKSDFVDLKHESLSRNVTDISSSSVDVWSLRQVKNSLGSTLNITYESDSYNDSILEIKPQLDIEGVTLLPNGNLKINIRDTDINMIKILNVGDQIDLKLFILFPHHLVDPEILLIEDQYLEHGELFEIYTTKQINANYLVEKVYTDGIEIKDGSLASDFDSDNYPQTVITEDCIGFYNGNVHTTIEFNKQVPSYSYGAISIPRSITSLGGGIRVESLELKTTVKSEFTKFKYSGGVTSFEPYGLDKIFLPTFNFNIECIGNVEGKLAEFKQSLYNGFEKILVNSRLLPAPGVMYKNVSLSEYVGNSNGSINEVKGNIEYQFQTFEESMVKRRQVPDGGGNVGAVDHKSAYPVRSMVFSNHTASVGALLRTTQYDAYGDKVSETENEYLKTFEGESILLDAYQGQGLISELYVENRRVRFEEDSEGVSSQGILTLHEEFPLVSKKQTTTDYRRGIVMETQNLSFDMYSGQPTEILSQDSYGNKFVSINVPAYHKYDGMGLAIHGAKNMLTQSAGSYTYELNQEKTLISAQNQTWDVIRQDRDINEEESQILFDKIPNSILKSSASGGNFFLINSDTKYFSGDRVRFVSEPYEVSSEYGNYTVVDDYLIEIKGWNQEQGMYELTPNDNMLNIISSKSGTVQLVSPVNAVWRKDRLYEFKGIQNELIKTNDFSFSDVDAFDSWYKKNDLDLEHWGLINEITLYDRYSHALEATDVNGNFAATKMDSKHEKVLATVANASYTEFAYSGAEDEVVDSYFGGTVSQGEATIYTASDDEDAHVHTGDASLSVATGGKAFSFSATPTQSRNMKVSVWSSQSDGLIKYKVNDGAEQTLSPKVRQAGSWYLLSAYIPAMNTGDELEIWCEAGGAATYFDDFRVHPIDAPMTAYVYNEYDELTFILDNNNLFTEYKYDEMGRLKEVHRESFKYGVKKTSETTINYAGSY